MGWCWLVGWAGRRSDHVATLLRQLASIVCRSYEYVAGSRLLVGSRQQAPKQRPYPTPRTNQSDRTFFSSYKILQTSSLLLHLAHILVK